MLHQQSVTLGKQTITLETGEVARQAHGSVVVRQGRALVLVTVVASHEPRTGAGFLPLTVEYREKSAAAGRVPGSFLRREGRISEDEVLRSRLIDRAVRPLFPKGFRHEVQVQATVFSADPEEADASVLALMGAGAALHLSPLPWNGPVGGVRVGLLANQAVMLPPPRTQDSLEADLVVAAGPGGLVMVEGGAREVGEARVRKLLEEAGSGLEPFFRAVEELREAAGATKWPAPETDTSALEAVRAHLGGRLETVLGESDKAARRRARAALEEEALAALAPEGQEVAEEVRAAVEALLSERIRERVLAEGVRMDGRGPEEIRPISCRVGWLQSAHGSAVFTRGETQAVVSCTLASQRREQLVETLGGPELRRFLLHYNFPPYSVGEVRPLRGPGRREIGHGALARRALAPVVPDFGGFPYVLRVESDITASNGSSSMATVCGSSLALMDAGVPVGAAVAGIAMGLLSGGDGRYAVLSDILGDEDHLGDMDFKVAGTRSGITALQMDNKLGALPAEVLSGALEQARRGRLHILDCMDTVLDRPREEVAGSAPRSITVRIQPDAAARVIGPKGSTIKGIQEQLKVDLSVDEAAGVVTVFGQEGQAARQAAAWVRDLAGVVESGRLYRARITGVREKLALVQVFETAQGAVHVSEWAEEHVETLRSVAREGDEVVVRVLGVDGRGRLRFSRRAALDAGAEEVVNEERSPAAP